MIQTIKMDIPPTMNELISANRTNRYVGAKMKKEWTNRISLQAKCDLTPYLSKVWISCLWQINHRRHDPDNLTSSLKFVFDGFVDAGIIVGDNLTTIQSPLVHNFTVGKELEKCLILQISDEPIYKCSVITPIT